MLLTLSQREELFFIEEGQRMQRKDIDLTTHTQKKYGDIHVVIIPLLLVMSLGFLGTLHAQFQTNPSSFLKPDKCFCLFLVASGLPSLLTTPKATLG